MAASPTEDIAKELLDAEIRRHTNAAEANNRTGDQYQQAADSQYELARKSYDRAAALRRARDLL